MHLAQRVSDVRVLRDPPRSWGGSVSGDVGACAELIGLRILESRKITKV